ncbi:MAG TPA: (2Fe-2S) ferredoxin domain-containing protein [Planctomycetes bacterium]|nr:(2Fe-2S) ferredoxin domain-containing protein [Planctomycetota bacterium]
MATFQRHLFVCTNERDEDDERGCCRARGGGKVAKALKIAAYEAGLKRIVRVNNAGCLDQCAHGVTCVVYPEGVWYGGVTPEDAEEIVREHLIAGRPVDRLRIPEDQLTGRLPTETPDH